MSTNSIEDYFSSIDLDIRKKGNNPRFIDQKCTPDVLSFLADCVVNLGKEIFTTYDIWKSTYFQKNAVLIFNKPSPNNEKVSNEYDKFISQPLDLMAYAGIIMKSKKGNKNVFKINAETISILEYISMRDRNAYYFLICYLNKMLSDSGFKIYIDDFIKKQTPDSFEVLKQKFEQFLIGNSKLGERGSENGGVIEARRIFPKVINVFSAEYSALGTQKGRISKNFITYKDLMYNEINFRDIGKLKNISRNEASDYKNSSPQKYNKFLIQKALQWIKRHHIYSEIKDDLYGKTSEVHHIFPKKLYPTISGYIENLIALTAGQHKDRAHPNSDGNRIDLMYQCTCLKAKNKTIQQELSSLDSSQYNKHAFIFVINTGFGKELIPQNASFKEIDELIGDYYKTAY